jgi:hypothetical protein
MRTLSWTLVMLAACPSSESSPEPSAVAAAAQGSLDAGVSAPDARPPKTTRFGEVRWQIGQGNCFEDASVDSDGHRIASSGCEERAKVVRTQLSQAQLDRVARAIDALPPPEPFSPCRAGVEVELFVYSVDKSGTWSLCDVDPGARELMNAMNGP